jgi:hypothetical protein
VLSGHSTVDENTVADQKSLRLIGWSFGAVAAAVMMIAAFLVVQTASAGQPVPALVARAASS